MEYELLKFFATHPGKVFTRETLLSRVWGYEYYGGARTVDVHVRRLRAKLGEEHANLIQTVRSVGYRFGQPRWTRDLGHQPSLAELLDDRLAALGVASALTRQQAQPITPADQDADREHQRHEQHDDHAIGHDPIRGRGSTAITLGHGRSP